MSKSSRNTKPFTLTKSTKVSSKALKPGNVTLATHSGVAFTLPVPPTPAVPAHVSPSIERLLDILTLRRGHGSVGERKLVEQVLRPYDMTTLTDPKGNPMAYTKVIGDNPTVLYTCHIDTVHPTTEDAKQVVHYDDVTELMYKSDNSPLGADDGAGVWLLLEMIREGIPGGYVFFRGEEKGGIGSKSVSENPAHTPWLKTFRYAIAFDRRDTCSVITHQARGRCCSDEFAAALAETLTDAQFTLKPDNGGIYTDTAELIGLIPECTNVSVGYFSEHSPSECLDVSYLLWLRERMLLLGADVMPTLPVKRDPQAIDVDSWYSSSDYWTQQYGTASPKSYNKQTRYVYDEPVIDPNDIVMDAHTLVEMRWREIVKWVQVAAPEDVADMLYDMAIELVYNRSGSDINDQ